MRRRGQRRPTSPTTFLSSLKRDSLVVAGSYATKKLHLVRLTSCARDTDDRHGKTGDYSDSWDGHALCGAAPTKTTFGHASTYYWKPKDISPQQAGDDLCGNCRRRWLSLDTDVVYTGSGRDTPEYPLPFGWKPEPPTTHPYDVAAGVDPATVVDGTGEVVGVARTEVYRWRRGPWVVRITHYYGDDTYAASYFHDRKVTNESHTVGPAGLTRVWRAAHAMMAAGPQP